MSGILFTAPGSGFSGMLGSGIVLRQRAEDPWVDPLADVSFLLRLQTHRGDNVPLGLFQDVSCLDPVTEEWQMVAAWRDELGGTGLVASQTDPNKRPVMVLEGGVPTLLFDGVDDEFDTLSGSVPIAANFDLYATGMRDLTRPWKPLGEVGNNNGALLWTNDKVYFQIGGSAAEAVTSLASGPLGIRVTRISNACTYEGTGQGALAMGSQAGTCTVGRVVPSHNGNHSNGSFTSVLLTADTSQGALVKAYLNDLFGALYA